MGKEDLANKYAETKIGELKAMIEGAYLKGYEQAVLDLNKSINIDGVEYVDMGLPSGTLWSKHPVDYIDNGECHLEKFSYSDALRFSIPTLEQAKELIDNSKCEEQFIYGPNGGKIGYKIIDDNIVSDLGDGCRGYSNLFWVKGEVVNNEAPAIRYGLRKSPSFGYSPVIAEIKEYFIGHHLPIFLVKTKE